MTTRERKLRPAIARPTIFGAAKPIRRRGIDQVNAALDSGVDRQTVPSLQRRAALWRSRRLLCERAEAGGHSEGCCLSLRSGLPADLPAR
jgi:hypothetical protein